MCLDIYMSNTHTYTIIVRHPACTHRGGEKTQVNAHNVTEAMEHAEAFAAGFGQEARIVWCRRTA